MKGTAALNAERALSEKTRAWLVEQGYRDPTVWRCERTSDYEVVTIFTFASTLGPQAMTAWIRAEDPLVLPGFLY